MTNNDYNRAALFGVVLSVGVVFLVPEDNVKPVEPKSNFEVVDRYQDRCDVVRWTNNRLAEYKYFEYKYFLDCSDKQH